MKIGQYCQRQRCKHVESEQFWHAFASRRFVTDSWAFLFCENHAKPKSEFSESYAKCDIYRYKALLIYMLPQKTLNIVKNRISMPY